MSSDAQRRPTAILFADIVGYSRLMSEDEAATLAGLMRLRDEVVEPAIAAHGGAVVKRLGDGWLAAFDGAGDAVRSAVEVQDRLGPGAPMRLRIGIHVGETSFVDGDIFGESVNLAARLEALAAPGGVAVSDAALAGVDPALRFQFEDAGPRSLKNIPDPVRVWARGGLQTAGAGDDGIATVLVSAFVEEGGEPGGGSLADGLSGDLVSEIARFRWLKVVAAEDGTDDRKHSSSPRYVVGGAVRRVGDRVRVSAHLTAAADGRRLWSERLDRRGDDVFALQDELAATLAAEACAVIDANEKTIARMRPVETLTATELSIRANDILSTGRIGGLGEADAMTKRAVALQPQNAQAHVQRSLVEYRKGISGAWPIRDTLAAALQPAREAVRLDPRLASGHGMLACIHGILGETDRALDAAARAAELNPAAWVGDHGRAIAHAFASPEWAARWDPDATGLIDAAAATLRKSSSSAFRSGHLFFGGLGMLLRDDAGDLAEPIAALERSAAAAGATWWPSVFLALAEARRGRRDVAASRIAEARDLLPALSLASVGDMFARSRIWPRWSRDIEDLPELGLPRQ